jgi:phosphoribosylaminoimidazole (AIR) synthetase
MKIATWNVNGIKARIDAARTWFKAASPDIALLQETKCVDDSFPHSSSGAVGDRESASESPLATVGDILLRPTTIYARAVRSVLTHYKVKSVIHGIAHITGGGLFENLARILPSGIGATIDRGSWPTPAVFPWLQSLGDVDDDEMHRVFNMGVGLVLVVSPYYAESIQQQLTTLQLESWPIGRAIEGDPEVRWS